MFTLEAIKAAHAKVKSGVDFPKYIQELKSLGLKSYTVYVTDGHTDYESVSSEIINAPAKYPALSIAQQTNAELFIQRLKLHQQGGTDYPAFCKDCADTGIEKWVVDLPTMTCTYYDTAGKNILVENIPQL